MILLEAMHLNNRGVSCWNAPETLTGFSNEIRGPWPSIALRSFADCLVEIQDHIRSLSSDPATSDASGSPPYIRRLMFRSHSVLLSSPREGPFIFDRAFEALVSEETNDAMTYLEMQDALECCACVIFNMALVHHHVFLQNGQEDDHAKAERLYQLSLNMFDPVVLSDGPWNAGSCPPNIYIWIQLGALNNLGSLQFFRGDLEGSRLYFWNLLGVLNFVEQQARTSTNHDLHTLLDEEEWNGMTSNCLSALFNLPSDRKIALAA